MIKDLLEIFWSSDIPDEPIRYSVVKSTPPPKQPNVSAFLHHCDLAMYGLTQPQIREWLKQNSTFSESMVEDLSGSALTERFILEVISKAKKDIQEK